MHYCDTCRKRWDWPEKDSGRITHCRVCGMRGKCHESKATELPLPDHRRLQVLTTEELPKEWADCMQISVVIDKEISDKIAEVAEMQKVVKKHNVYIQLLNKLYFGGGLGDNESTILVV